MIRHHARLKGDDGEHCALCGSRDPEFWDACDAPAPAWVCRECASAWSSEELAGMLARYRRERDVFAEQALAGIEKMTQGS